MAESMRPDPFFLADDPALDLLNSVAAPWGKGIEWLGKGEDYLGWLEKAGLIPSEVSRKFRDKKWASALDEVAAQARDLREWFRTFVKTHAGQPLEATALSDLKKINAVLERGGTYRQIELRSADAEIPSEVIQDERGQSAFQWHRHRRWQSPEDLLIPLAEAMGDLICMGNFSRVKNCEGPTCTLWFNDISKNHTRRWCTMAVCGNRAKAAAHRARKQTVLAEQGLT